MLMLLLGMCLGGDYLFGARRVQTCMSENLRQWFRVRFAHCLASSSESHSAAVFHRRFPSKAMQTHLVPSVPGTGP